MKNKEKVLALIESFESGDPIPLAEYVNQEKYIQHNHRLGNGVAGLREFFKHVPPHSIERHVYRALEDGDFVVVHSSMNFFGPKVMFNVYRFEDGKMVEHWDNVQEDGRKSPSGHSMFDGSDELKDLDKTKFNKDLVRKVVNEVFIKAKTDNLYKYFAPDCIEHNPEIEDGLPGLIAGLKLMHEKHGREYHRIHRVIGEGNFVFTICEGVFESKPASHFDMFRVEAGKIAEHWDVMEHIPSQEEWKNENGKF